MAILSRPRLLPQQRLDLEDIEVLLSGLCADAKNWTGEFWGSTQLILKGFNISGLAGPSPALITVDGSTLINANNTGSFSWFTGAAGDPPLQAVLNPSARNFLELELSTENGTPLTRAFWDPSAQGGLGAEFNQTVDTVTNIKIDVVVLLGGFSGSPDRIKLGIVDADGANNITQIFDERDLFFRLGTPSDPEADFGWGSQTEPELTITLTGVSGTFVAGETVTFDGAETAEVQTGGTTTVGVILPSAKTMSAGDAVVGADSGATGTLAFVTDTFSGADKSIDNLREQFQAFATEIKSIKGTRFWFETGFGSISGINNFLNARTVNNPSASGSRFEWDGTNLKILDDNVAPADADVMGFLRIFNRTDDLSLTRQDDGLEIQTVTFSPTPPDTGVWQVEHDGQQTANINFDDDAAAVQAAWDASAIVEAVTITGSYTDGFQIAFSALGDKNAVTVPVNTLQKDAGGVTPTITETKKGQASDESIPIADGEIMFIKVPATGARVYDGVGSGDTNYQTVALGSYVNSDETYWLAIREGAVLYSRTDVINPGEGSALSGGAVPASLLAILGISSENTPAVYTSNIRGQQGESFVSRMSTNTDAIGDAQEDRSGYLRSDDLVTWDGAQLSMISDIILELINTKDGTITQHEIDISNSPISIADGESIYVLIDREVASETLTLVNSGTTPIPAQNQFNKDIFVLFRRVDAAGAGFLHIPFHKQVLEPGQTVRLGASGSGGGGGASLEEDIKRRLVLSPFTYATPNIFEVDEEDKVDGASTGVFDAAAKAFKLNNLETMLSTQNLDAEFLSQGIDVPTVELYLKWVLAEFDDAALYEVSRDGGNEFQVITMDRIGATNALQGRLEFAEEASNQTLDEYNVSNADTNLNFTDTGSQQSWSTTFTPSTTRVWKEVEIYLNKIEAGGGNVQGGMTLKIVADDSGQPSTDPTDILSESGLLDLVALATGDTATLVDLSDVVLVSGVQYWLVYETDAAYKASFSAAVDEVRVRADTSAPTGGATSQFNGTIWTDSPSTSLTFSGKGREHDLRVRVTGGTADALLEGYGLYYGFLPGLTASGVKQVDKFFFTGDENRTDFTLNFLPDPDLLVVYDPFRGQTYVATEGVFRIDGSTVIFDVDFFDFPGEDIVLIFRQNEGTSFDDSDQNANAIATIQSNLIDIGDELDSLSDSMVVSKIPVPNTQITNRAQIVDLANDLKPRFGIDRIMTQEISEIQGEFGPNGEAVFGVVNDKLGQIRCVGRWESFNDTSGLRLQVVPADAADDFIEITFFGTGLNWLTNVTATSRDLRATIDGGPEGANLYPSGGSDVLNSRSAQENGIINVASGLSLGIHTIKLRVVSSSATPILDGFEILNEEANGNIIVNSGTQLFKGKRLIHNGPTSLSFNSGFETGTLGTRGGQVSIYQKSDGSVAHAANPTDGAQANLGSTTHVNEEIIGRHYWREFGVARVDDLSTLTFSATSDRAFTLDDGTTTLVGNNVEAVNSGVRIQASSGLFLALTFVGTGLDIQFDSTLTGTDPKDVIIDGTTVGQIGVSIDDDKFIEKIVSGLPYGSHTVRFESDGTAATANLGISDFIVYGPKKPALPTGAKELGSYFVMADFVANVVDGILRVSEGVLRKDNTREMVYTGAGWSASVEVTNNAGGLDIRSSTSTDAMSYTFFGTGFDLRFNTAAGASAIVDVDGSTDFTGTTNVFSGAMTFNTSTGQLSGDSAPGSFLSVSGLTLGLHTVTLTLNASNVWVHNSVDVHAPIYTPKLNGPFVLQNTLRSGSQSIKDERKFSKKDVVDSKTISKTIPLGFSVTSSTDNSHGVVVPIFVEEDGDYILNMNIAASNGGAGAVTFKVFLDGEEVMKKFEDGHPGSSQTRNYDNMKPIRLSRGTHTVVLFGNSTAGALTAGDSSNIALTRVSR